MTSSINHQVTSNNSASLFYSQTKDNVSLTPELKPHATQFINIEPLLFHFALIVMSIE